MLFSWLLFLQVCMTNLVFFRENVSFICLFVCLDLISAAFVGDGCCVRWSYRRNCCRSSYGYCCEDLGGYRYPHYPDEYYGRLPGHSHVSFLSIKIQFHINFYHFFQYRPGHHREDFDRTRSVSRITHTIK